MFMHVTFKIIFCELDPKKEIQNFKIFAVLKVLKVLKVYESI